MNLSETPYTLSTSILQMPFTLTETLLSIGMLVCVIALYLSLPKALEKYEALILRRKKIEKRHILSELVIMKEIQTEIDEEMRQAMIRRALRDKEQS